MALGDLAAVERVLVLRVDVLRLDVPREVERVDGLRVVVDLRAVVLRAAGLRAVLDVLVVLLVVVLLVVSAMFGSQPLSTGLGEVSVRSCSIVTVPTEHMYVNPGRAEVTRS